MIGRFACFVIAAEIGRPSRYRERARFGVESICAVLCEHDIKIAPSTFYARQACPVPNSDWDDAHTANRLLDLWRANRSLYGATKLHAAPLDAGMHPSTSNVALYNTADTADTHYASSRRAHRARNRRRHQVRRRTRSRTRFKCRVSVVLPHHTRWYGHSTRARSLTTVFGLIGTPGDS